MALYKTDTNVRPVNDAAFDVTYRPGERGSYSGLYQCINCGDEYACNQGNPLPPQNHHQHNPPSPIVWRLHVYAEVK
jgi:hypothetical protein